MPKNITGPKLLFWIFVAGAVVSLANAYLGPVPTAFALGCTVGFAAALFLIRTTTNIAAKNPALKIAAREAAKTQGYREREAIKAERQPATTGDQATADFLKRKRQRA